MGKTLKYVQEFDFSSAGKPVGYCMGGKVAKKAAGGPVQKREMPTQANKGGAERGKERAASMSGRTFASGMVPDTEALGVRGNVDPGIRRKSVPVAPNQPMISAYKKGGPVAKRAAGGLTTAADASGRTMPTAGRPAMTGLDKAAAMSGRAMPATGRPAMKTGGAAKKYADGGLAQAAAMSGRAMPTALPPAMTGLNQAAAMAGRQMPVTGRPVMKKGGAVGKKK